MTPARLLTPGALRLFAFTDVDPPVHWVTSMPRPPISYHEHVNAHEAMLYIRDQRTATKTSTVPRCVAVNECRESEFAHPQLCQAVVDLKSLYPHQCDAIDSSTQVIDENGESSTVTVHSGVWVMPCGVGKTLSAVVQVIRLGMRALILVPNVETGMHWMDEFAKLGITAVHVHGDTRSSKAKSGGYDSLLRDPPAIVTMTYPCFSMAYRNQIAPASSKGVEVKTDTLFLLHVLRYGTLILDEAHMLPAHTYEEAALAMTAPKYALAVTAELHRSDGRSHRIEEIVGPVLYRMTRDEALNVGVATDVTHTVVCIDKPINLFVGLEDTYAGRRIATVLNPEKMRALCALLREDVHNKILVYCDKIAALDYLADVVRGADPARLFAGIFRGSTTTNDRIAIINRMRTSPRCACILSRAGDSSFDVRDADTIIEMDVGDRSLQKITQRIGRAQRVHQNKSGARAYTLVTRDTFEVSFAQERERRDANQSIVTTWRHDAVSTVASVPSTFARDVRDMLRTFDERRRTSKKKDYNSTFKKRHAGTSRFQRLCRKAK